MCCMAMGEAAGTASALAVQENVKVGDVDIPKLQNILVANKGNIGQGYRKIPGLIDGDYSEFALKFHNAKTRNGKEYLFLKKN